MMGSGAFDTPGAKEAVSLGVSVALAFGTLRYGAFRSGRFKGDFGIKEGLYKVDVFVVGTRFEVNKE